MPPCPVFEQAARVQLLASVVRNFALEAAPSAAAASSESPRPVPACWRASAALAEEALRVHAARQLCMQHRMCLAGAEASPASQVHGAAPGAARGRARVPKPDTWTQPPACPDGATCGIERRFATCGTANRTTNFRRRPPRPQRCPCALRVNTFLLASHIRSPLLPRALRPCRLCQRMSIPRLAGAR